MDLLYSQMVKSLAEVDLKSDSLPASRCFCVSEVIPDLAAIGMQLSHRSHKCLLSDWTIKVSLAKEEEAGIVAEKWDRNVALSLLLRGRTDIGRSSRASGRVGSRTHSVL